MSQNRILLKKSSVVGKIPSTSDVEYGELALNFSDGRLYFKNSDNSIDFFQSGVTSSNATLPFPANEGDFGSVAISSTNSEFDLGSLSENENFSHDLGELKNTISPDSFILPSFNTSDLPEGTVGEMIFVTNEVNGSIPAFFDGSDWKRLSDNQIVTPS